METFNLKGSYTLTGSYRSRVLKSFKMAEHMEIYNLTGKFLKKGKQSAISDHLLQCNCFIKFDEFIVLATDSKKVNYFSGRVSQ